MILVFTTVGAKKSASFHTKVYYSSAVNHSLKINSDKTARLETYYRLCTAVLFYKIKFAILTNHITCTACALNSLKTVQAAVELPFFLRKRHSSLEFTVEDIRNCSYYSCSYSRRQNKVPIVYRLTTDLRAELSAKVAEKSP